MKSRLLSLLLPLAVSAALASDPAPMQPFPDDYTPSPCAQPSCQSFERSAMSQAAGTFLGLPLEGKWVAAHGDEMATLVGPACRKQATCQATPGNNTMFCNDIVVSEIRDVCDKRFPLNANRHDHEQCQAYVETFALGVDQKDKASYEAAQACATRTPPTQKSKPPLVWMKPASFGPDYQGSLIIYAIDPDTHVPVQSTVSIGGQILYAPSNPAGNLQAYYPFTWPLRYDRVQNAAGHVDLVPPTVTVTADHYPPVIFKMPVAVPGLKLQLVPPATQLHPGKNTVTVFAADSVTGKPVELRVMFGGEIAGPSNSPIELQIERKAKRPEIWVTSLFKRYSDAVIVPAQK
ncbi:MAG: hypothetical protein ABI837_16195 [Acidobacteriota bacterium]